MGSIDRLIATTIYASESPTNSIGLDNGIAPRVRVGYTGYTGSFPSRQALLLLVIASLQREMMDRTFFSQRLDRLNVFLPFAFTASLDLENDGGERDEFATGTR